MGALRAAGLVGLVLLVGVLRVAGRDRRLVVSRGVGRLVRLPSERRWL